MRKATIWFLFLFFATPAYPCPDFCRCSLLKAKKKDEGGSGHKVLCNRLSLTNLEKLDIEAMPKDTAVLVISNSILTKIKSGTFSALENVTRLDLSNNQIVQIEDFAFANMTSLKKLDLSENLISALGPDVFSGLPSLEKLDLKNNSLMCDCHFQWFLNWRQNSDIKLTTQSTCQYPAQLRGLSLSKLTIKDTHCNYPLQLPAFELLPSSNQLVFEGDAFVLECLASDIDSETKILWYLDNRNVETGDLIRIAQKTNSGVITSFLTVNSLSLNQTGTWMCQAATKRGNLSRTINVVVVSQKSPLCIEEITWGNKGQYHWLPTLAGIKAEIPCSAISTGALGYKHAKAVRSCGMNGEWEFLDASGCPYISDVTNILEQFAKTNLSQSKTVIDTARGLRNYTGNGSSLTDVMDLVYIAQTLENYLSLVPQHKELGDILLGVISAILGLDKDFLKLAQEEDQACSKLSNLIHSLASAMADSSLNHFHDNLIVEEFLVKSESFPGMRCTSFQDVLSNWGRNLHCISVNATIPLNIEKQIKASIFVPHSVFSPTRKSNQRSTPVTSIPTSRGTSRKLQFALYRTNALFPRLANDQDITSAIISCQTVPAQTKTLSQPIEITLSIPAYTEDAKPARWDPIANDGKGDWSTQGCNTISVVGQSLTFSCSRLGAYGILQDEKALEEKLRYQKAQFRLSHPAIYVGSLFLSPFLFLSIVFFHREWKTLKMPKKMKHSLLNTWIAMLALLVIFTLGVSQTDFPLVCQILGLAMHYLTLCTLIWMIISANNMYKHLTRNDPVDLPPDEPMPDPTIEPKPIMQFYLVGWGISLIICGIMAAIQINAYCNSSFCFLSNTSSLASFYGPVLVFLLLNSIYFLLIQCQYNREIETSGVFLVGSPTNTNADTDSMIDLEFCPSSHLRALIFVLFLFAVVWSSAAVTVVRPLKYRFPYDSLVFGLIYCTFCALLGMFVFGYYCYFRRESKNIRWLGGCSSVKGSCNLGSVKERSSIINVTDNFGQEATVSVSLVEKVSNDGVQLTKEPLVSNSCNINLLSTRNIIDDSANNTPIELFYNPRQSVAARRFFEKNRRQQQLKALQKNNLAKAQTSYDTEPYSRVRAYSDTEKASSTYGSGINEEKSQLCTSQSYSGPGIGMRSEAKNSPVKTALNVQNGLVEIHAEPLLVQKPSSPTKLNSKEYSRNLTKNCANFKDVDMVKPPKNCFSTLPNHCERSSCSECSKCNQNKPASLCSQSCYSDFTSVSQNAQKRRSRSTRNRWRKNSRQYSWDDKYDNNRVKMFIQPSPSSPGAVGTENDSNSPVTRKNSRKKSKRRLDSQGSHRSRDRSFSRSQSAYEQMTPANDKILSDDGLTMAKPPHQETKM